MNEDNKSMRQKKEVMGNRVTLSSASTFQPYSGQAYSANRLHSYWHALHMLSAVVESVLNIYRLVVLGPIS